jgi:CubicO group peptidase (beta-lactamase class C family)
LSTNLDKLARSLTSGAEPFAFCGIALSHGGATRFHTATADGIIADEHSMFRVASVSKIVTAAAFEGAANLKGFYRPYDVDAGPILGIDLRHPQFPHTPVTLGMLMTHTSGLTDDAGYAFDGTIAESWHPPAVFGPHEPGSYFLYSNLGYILLAAAAEAIAGDRFDALVADAMSHNGAIAGFNWAGLDHTSRAKFLPTYRRDGSNFIPMIDGDAPTPFEPDTGYRLGQHTAQFSPQGGLRTSLRGMLKLAMTGAGVPREPLWQQTDGDGDYLDGLFQDYGAGEQILSKPPFYPRPLVGHFGNAYGFNGGVWWDPEADICFAYALNGVPMGDENDALSEAEHAIFAVIAQVA